MKQHITGRFDSLHEAEEAATKLNAIRASEVEISEWHGGDEFQLIGGQGLPPIGLLGGSFPSTGSTISAGGLGLLSPMTNDYVTDTPRRGFLLNAVIEDEERKKAVRIIRDSGGREY